MRTHSLGWQVTLRRCALPVLVLMAVGACARPGVSDKPSWQGLDAPRGERVTLLSEEMLDQSAENFLINAAVAQSDGTVALSYDLNAPAAGSDVSDGPGPQLVSLQADGSFTAIVLPAELDGIKVSPASLPLVAAPDGTLYIWDATSGRILSRTPKNDWAVAASLSKASVYGTPRAAVGPDDTLFVETAVVVLRVEADGGVTIVAAKTLRPNVINV